METPSPDSGTSPPRPGIDDVIRTAAFNIRPAASRPEGRIDELLAVLAADWKRTGSDQRFFQYVENLRHRLGISTDPYFFEDDALIGYLRAEAGPHRDRPL